MTLNGMIYHSKKNFKHDRLGQNNLNVKVGGGIKR